MKIYEDLLSSDSLNKELNYYDGICKFNLKQYKAKARLNFDRSGPGISPDWYYYYGSLLHIEENFEAAITHFNKFKSINAEKTITDEEVMRAIESSSIALKYMAAPNKQKIINVGSVINSKYAEYSPLISSDGKILYFTSRRPVGGEVVDKSGRYYEDIFMSTIDDKTISSPRKLPATINTKYHDACTGIGADGESMFIFRSSETVMDGQILTTLYDGVEWTQPVALDEEINKEGSHEVSACVSLSGNEIYFSSDREGGFGGKDIYRIRKLPNGKWSKAMNLGSIVNSAGDEDAPFIHPDNMHLYYSSNGHLGMGGYDVFVAELDSNNYAHINTNMGYPINTTDDDIYFTITGDKRMGYYSSVRADGMGESDIYMIYLEGEEPFKEVYEGYVHNRIGTPIEAKITLIDKTDGKLAGTYKSNMHSGKFILLIFPGHDYEIVFESKYYHSLALHLSDIVDAQFYLEPKNHE